MRKIELALGSNLDEAIELLLKAKAEGKSVYCDFNGHILYSDDITVDSAYMEVCGKTKAEYDEDRRIWYEKYEKEQAREKEEARKNIPMWIEEGRQYIYPQKMDDWKDCVIARVNDLYHGRDVRCALDVMQILDCDYSFEVAKNMIDDQGHSGSSYYMVMNMLATFAKRGPDFYEYMEDNISKESKEYLDNQRKLNKQYEEELSNIDNNTNDGMTL